MSIRRCMVWSLAAATLILPMTGCVSRVQGTDFVRTEFARLTADLVGQFLLILIQATSPFSAA
ncbi:MAG: hypothetical protein KF841_06005 [Phycisphaerae bacterium]|nr:hypothetical protein [Phycisphaerae bacterium]